MPESSILGNIPTRPHSAWFEHYAAQQRPQLQLFCFPYAGGAAQIFRSWRRELPSEVGLWTVNLPGREKRIQEALLTRLPFLIKSMADAIIQELQPPFAFYGHSMGAVLSFELTRELRRRRATEPVHLFVSGRHAPQLPDTQPCVFNLPDSDFIAELRRLNGTPKELLESPELLEFFLPVIRADFELIETYEYVPEAPLSCSITAYGGLQDVDVPIDSVHAWKQQTTSDFMTRLLPGDHFFINNPGFHTTFAKDLADVVFKCRRR